MIIMDKTKDPKIKVNDKIILKQSFLDGNEKIVDYLDANKRCKRCSMIMDPDERNICKYCTGDF